MVGVVSTMGFGLEIYYKWCKAQKNRGSVNTTSVSGIRFIAS
jgi:hypothetical protein